MHLNYIIYAVFCTARRQNTPNIELIFINFESILHFSFSLLLFTNKVNRASLLYKIIYFESTL